VTKCVAVRSAKKQYMTMYDVWTMDYGLFPTRYQLTYRTVCRWCVIVSCWN